MSLRNETFLWKEEKVKGFNGTDSLTKSFLCPLKGNTLLISFVKYKVSVCNILEVGWREVVEWGEIMKDKDIQRWESEGSACWLDWTDGCKHKAGVSRNLPSRSPYL